MVVEISVVVIAAFIVIFVIALIPVLFQVKRTAGEAEKLLDTVRQQIVPISHDLTLIVNDIKNIVKTIDKQMVKVEDSVEAVRDTMQRIRVFEGAIQDKIEKPIYEIVAVLSALVKGIRVFLEFMRKR